MKRKTKELDRRESMHLYFFKYKIFCKLKQDPDKAIMVAMVKIVAMLNLSIFKTINHWGHSYAILQVHSYNCYTLAVIIY